MTSCIWIVFGFFFHGPFFFSITGSSVLLHTFMNINCFLLFMSSFYSLLFCKPKSAAIWISCWIHWFGLLFHTSILVLLLHYFNYFLESLEGIWWLLLFICLIWVFIYFETEFRCIAEDNTGLSILSRFHDCWDYIYILRGLVSFCLFFSLFPKCQLRWWASRLVSGSTSSKSNF